MKWVLTLVILACTIELACSIECDGRRNLKQGKTISCLHLGNKPDIKEPQSCLVEERHDSDEHCTANSCVEVNIMLDTEEYGDSKNLIWSFSSCFKPEMKVRICAPGYDPDFINGTVGMTSTTSNPNTTSTATETTSTTTAQITTTAEGNATSTTTAELTSSTPMPSTTEKPAFIGCYVGEVEFGCSQCKEKEVEAELEDEHGLLPNVDVIVQIVGCCSESHCKVATPKDADNKCYYGDNNNLYSVRCSSECYGYVHIDKDGKQISLHGCLSDLHYDEIVPFKPKSCTSTYEDGVCQDISTEEACIRCCDTPHCNSWTTKQELIDAKTPSSAHFLFPSLCLLLLNWIVTAFI